MAKQPDDPKADEKDTAKRTDDKQQRAEARDDSWDNDEAVSMAAYQAIIERLQDKGDKEVARIVKVFLASIQSD